MTRLRTLLLLVLFVTANSCALASQEGISPLASFTVTAIEETAPVVVTGQAHRGVITALKISAFEKEFVLSSEHLEKLKGLVFNGIQLSGEGGYKGLGGRILYVTLLRGWTISKGSQVVIAVQEEGGIEIKLKNSQ